MVPLKHAKQSRGNASFSFQQHVQEFNSSLQSQMQQHRKSIHREHPPKVQSQKQQHFNEVQKLVKLGEKSDSYAKHFATQFHDTNPSPINQRGGITCNIIWQGNPISAVKTFTTKNCSLCAKERIAILKVVHHDIVW